MNRHVPQLFSCVEEHVPGLHNTPEWDFSLSNSSFSPQEPPRAHISVTVKLNPQIRLGYNAMHCPKQQCRPVPQFIQRILPLYIEGGRSPLALQLTRLESDNEWNVQALQSYEGEEGVGECNNIRCKAQAQTYGVTACT